MSAPAPARPVGPRQRLLQVLACSALGPGLDGVLLFDLEPEMVAPVTDAFAALLQLREQRPVRRATLGSVTGDDELWLRPTLGHDGNGVNFSLSPGPLVDDSADSALVVVVPDLVRLSLPGMRAAVQLLGADVAAVERSGFRARWRPRARWLAACQEAEIGRLSPHLLDRFPIRLNAAGLRRTSSGPDRVLDALDGRGPEPGLGELPPSWRSALTARTRPACTLTEEAAAHVVGLFRGDTSGRRAIGLARLARVLAVVNGADTCGPDRVDEAARLLGVAAPPGAPAGTGHSADGTSLATGDGTAGSPPPPEQPKPDPVPEETAPTGQPGNAMALPAGPAEALDTFTADTGEGQGSPFPEDDARFLREFAPLRIPWQRRPEPSSARGPVIGVRSATTLRDLAVVATVVEAAKHQNLPGRRALRAAGDGQLMVLPGDFRSYARLPVAERMLVLLLDHTCRRGWDWQPALAPYLQWAYTGRASVCLVEVGSRDAAHELRADHFIARSVLDPRVGSALHRRPGRSTPLAHGLTLTDQLLRRAFQQRSNLVEAWLVVVSDGRGNVPLDASAGGRLLGPVRRAGIDDAITAAAHIGAMGRMRLHSVVVDAARQPHPDLPFLLADALGGVTVAGRTTRGAMPHVH
ncbi:magnesium chelatase [Streptomyces sp. NPDC090083]|uniref:magnesium chelatase n=1 Tax=Streptomyces sp. NPDC090083 TaxID=3365941 RepID=UPI0037FD8D54